MASGLATLSILNRQPEIYRQLEDKTQYLSAGLASILNEKGMPHTINQRGSMMSVFFSATPVVDFQTAALANNDYFNRFFHGMLDRGVYLAPSSFETWFLAITHTQALLDRTLDAARSVIKSL
jgi:glutamate-1-semialdehyde 2,1-aminomutase